MVEFVGLLARTNSAPDLTLDSRISLFFTLQSCHRSSPLCLTRITYLIQIYWARRKLPPPEKLLSSSRHRLYCRSRSEGGKLWRIWKSLPWLPWFASNLKPHPILLPSWRHRQIVTRVFGWETTDGRTAKLPLKTEQPKLESLAYGWESKVSRHGILQYFIWHYMRWLSSIHWDVFCLMWSHDIRTPSTEVLIYSTPNAASALCFLRAVH